MEVNAWLPDASRFSREIGRLGFSLEMLTPALVIDLSVYACTDSTCRPGGRPVTNRYRLAFKIYQRSTHAADLLHRELDLPGSASRLEQRQACAGPPAGLSLFYDHRNGALFAAAGRYAYNNYPANAGMVVNQARIGVELGSTPWSAVPFRAPARESAPGLVRGSRGPAV